MWVTSSLQKAICLPSTSFPWGSERDARHGNGCCCARGTRRLSAPAHTPVDAKGTEPRRCTNGKVWSPKPSPQLLLSSVLLSKHNCLVILERKFSAAATGCSWHRAGQRNWNNSQVRKSISPPSKCSPRESTPKSLREERGGISILTHCTFQAWIWNYSWKSSNIPELIFRRVVLVSSGFFKLFFIFTTSFPLLK